jgi:hypothetical protein
MIIAYLLMHFRVIMAVFYSGNEMDHPFTLAKSFNVTAGGTYS